MCVYIHVYTCVCTFVHIHVCTCVCTFVYIHVCTCVCTFVYIHVYTCVCTFVYIHVYTCVCTFVYIHVYTCCNTLIITCIIMFFTLMYQIFPLNMSVVMKLDLVLPNTSFFQLTTFRYQIQYLGEVHYKPPL